MPSSLALAASAGRQRQPPTGDSTALGSAGSTRGGGGADGGGVRAPATATRPPRIRPSYGRGGSSLSSHSGAYRDDEDDSDLRPVCTFYQRGACNRGASCRFRHVDVVRRPPPQAKADEAPLCTFYARGMCARGSSCRFRHDDDGDDEVVEEVAEGEEMRDRSIHGIRARAAKARERAAAASATGADGGSDGGRQQSSLATASTASDNSRKGLSASSLNAAASAAPATEGRKPSSLAAAAAAGRETKSDVVHTGGGATMLPSSAATSEPWRNDDVRDGDDELGSLAKKVNEMIKGADDVMAREVQRARRQADADVARSDHASVGGEEEAVSRGSGECSVERRAELSAIAPKSDGTLAHENKLDVDVSRGKIDAGTKADERDTLAAPAVKDEVSAVAASNMESQLDKEAIQDHAVDDVVASKPKESEHVCQNANPEVDASDLIEAKDNITVGKNRDVSRRREIEVKNVTSEDPSVDSEKGPGDGEEGEVKGAGATLISGKESIPAMVGAKSKKEKPLVGAPAPASTLEPTVESHKENVGDTGALPSVLTLSVAATSNITKINSIESNAMQQSGRPTAEDRTAQLLPDTSNEACATSEKDDANLAPAEETQTNRFKWDASFSTQPVSATPAVELHSCSVVDDSTLTPINPINPVAVGRGEGDRAQSSSKSDDIIVKQSPQRKKKAVSGDSSADIRIKNEGGPEMKTTEPGLHGSHRDEEKNDAANLKNLSGEKVRMSSLAAAAGKRAPSGGAEIKISTNMNHSSPKVPKGVVSSTISPETRNVERVNHVSRDLCIQNTAEKVSADKKASSLAASVVAKRTSSPGDADTIRAETVSKTKIQVAKGVSSLAAAAAAGRESSEGYKAKAASGTQYLSTGKHLISESRASSESARSCGTNLTYKTKGPALERLYRTSQETKVTPRTECRFKPIDLDVNTEPSAPSKKEGKSTPSGKKASSLATTAAAGRQMSSPGNVRSCRVDTGTERKKTHVKKGASSLAAAAAAGRKSKSPGAHTTGCQSVIKQPVPESSVSPDSTHAREQHRPANMESPVWERLYQKSNEAKVTPQADYSFMPDISKSQRKVPGGTPESRRTPVFDRLHGSAFVRFERGYNRSYSAPVESEQKTYQGIDARSEVRRGRFESVRGDWLKRSQGAKQSYPRPIGTCDVDKAAIVSSAITTANKVGGPSSLAAAVAAGSASIKGCGKEAEGVSTEADKKVCRNGSSQPMGEKRTTPTRRKNGTVSSLNPRAQFLLSSTIQAPKLPDSAKTYRGSRHGGVKTSMSGRNGVKDLVSSFEGRSGQRGTEHRGGRAKKGKRGGQARDTRQAGKDNPRPAQGDAKKHKQRQNDQGHASKEVSTKTNTRSSMGVQKSVERGEKSREEAHKPVVKTTVLHGRWADESDSDDD